MLKNREIRLSIKDRLRAMFQTVEAGAFANSYNVYTEADFRSVPSGTFTPSFPFIYIMDSFLPPVEQRRDLQEPYIVVEIDRYTNRPFELGNRLGRRVDVLVHVFGRNRPERDDIGSYIVDYFGNSLSIKTYTPASPSGTEVEQALVDDEKYVEDVFTARSDVAEPQQVLGWTTVKLTLWCKL